MWKKLLLIITFSVCVLSSINAKSIVIYFSKTGEQYNVGVINEGNTAKVAKEIARQTNSDIWEIVPVKKYPEAYKATTEVAIKEQREKARPAIKGPLPDLSIYDTIYLGYPIWWEDLPMCVYTFLESVNLSGKTIMPFCTNEGSGECGTSATIQKLQKKAVVKKTLSIRGTTAQNNHDTVVKEVIAWLGR